MAIAPTGDGGLFCAYREDYGGLPYLSVARITAVGGFAGKVVVAALGTMDSDLMVGMAPTGSGDVIVVWNLNDPGPDKPLVAARVTGALTVAWQTTGLFANVVPDPRKPGWCGPMGRAACSWPPTTNCSRAARNPASNASPMPG